MTVERVRVVNSENGPRAQPVAPASPRTPAPGPGPGPEKVVIDPRKGGQVDAKEKAGQALALAVKEGVWVWDGVVGVLQIDLFRYVNQRPENVVFHSLIPFLTVQIGRSDTVLRWLYVRWSRYRVPPGE